MSLRETGSLLAEIAAPRWESGQTVASTRAESKDARLRALGEIFETAAKRGDAEEMRFLVSLGVDGGAFRSRSRNDGGTILHVAADCPTLGAPEVIRFCVEELGIPVDIENAHCSTPIMLAAFAGNQKAFATLLALGADPWWHKKGNGVGERSKSLMQSALASNDLLPFFEFLMKAPEFASKINEAVPWGMYKVTPLHLALNDLDKMKIVLAAGGDPNGEAFYAKDEALRVLPWLFKNWGGGAPWRERFKVLVKAGADVAYRDKDGKTILDIARANVNRFPEKDLRYLETEMLSAVAKHHGNRVKRARVTAS